MTQPIGQEGSKSGAGCENEGSDAATRPDENRTRQNAFKAATLFSRYHMTSAMPVAQPAVTLDELVAQMQTAIASVLDVTTEELAREYHRQCEAFDRTVCTGPITADGIMPATPRELAQVNAFAARMRRECVEQAQRYGVSAETMQRAIAAFNPSMRGDE